MEKANTSKMNWTRKCIECDVNFCIRDAFVLHLLGKRHQKKVRKRDKSHLNDVRERTMGVTGKLRYSGRNVCLFKYFLFPSLSLKSQGLSRCHSFSLFIYTTFVATSISNFSLILFLNLSGPFHQWSFSSGVNLSTSSIFKM